MSDLNIQGGRNDGPSEANFVVPFEQNPHFVGRKDFLSYLKETSSDELPKKYNHRVALY